MLDIVLTTLEESLIHEAKKKDVKFAWLNHEFVSQLRCEWWR